MAGRLAELAAEHPGATESEIGWLAVEELSVAAAALLEPAFRASGGRDGRLSIQTDPRLWRDADRLVEQAVHFDGLAPNVIVKIPATSAGIAAIEEVTPAASASTRRSRSPSRRRSPWVRRSSAGCAGARRPVTTSAAWARSARSWWAGWTTG